MKHLICLLFACAVLTPTLLAQAGEGRRPLADGETAISVPMETEVVLPAARRVRYAWTLTMTGRSDGFTLAIDGATITTTGDPEAIASMTAADIFDLVARRSIIGAIDLGYVPRGGVAEVTHASCVTRTATGLTAGSTSTVRRSFSIGNSPLAAAALVSVHGTTDCTAPAEATFTTHGPSMQ